MSTDAQPAAPSAAPDAPLSFSAFEAAQNALDRGETPVSTSDAKPADSSPAPAAEQPASTEVTPTAASEAAKPRKTAEDRIPELLRERALERDARLAAERERDELRARLQPQDATPAAPSPAPAAETFPEYDAFLLQPGNEEKSYETYIRELARFETDQRWAAKEREREEQATRQRESQTVQERNAKFSERLEAAGGDEFLKTLSDEVQSLRPVDAIRDAKGRWTERPTGYHALTSEILQSDVAPQLLRHFSDNAADLHRLAKLTPDAMYKEFGRLEARLSVPAAPSAPAAKTVTDAPPPPDTLGKRPAAAADPRESAIARRDFRAYEAAENQRELAVRGRR